MQSQIPFIFDICLEVNKVGEYLELNFSCVFKVHVSMAQWWDLYDGEGSDWPSKFQHNQICGKKLQS